MYFIKVEQERFDIQSIQKDEELKMLEHVKSEQGTLLMEIEELDQQIQKEKQNFKERKEKSIKKIENTKLEIEANRAEVNRAASKLEKTIDFNIKNA